MNASAALAGRILLALAASIAVPAGSASDALLTEEVQLGALIFGERRLSTDGQVSCATCHMPTRGFTDGLPTSKGVYGRVGTRNAPSLVSISSQTSFSWDGRHDRLEAQVIAPLSNPVEHGLASIEQAAQILNESAEYRGRFQRLYGESASAANVGRPLAAFIRTLNTAPSRGERYASSPSPDLLSISERRGFELFVGRAGCGTCHRFDATGSVGDGEFHALALDRQAAKGAAQQRAAALSSVERELAISRDAAVANLGRFNVTRDPADIGKFRTPSLRNIAMTTPYMHDGSIASLEEAVEAELYYRNARTARPLFLTPQEKRDLISFLRSLSAE